MNPVQDFKMNLLNICVAQNGKTIIYIDCPLMSNYSLFRSDAHLFEKSTLFLIKDAELKTMDISFVLWSFFQLYINRVKLHFQVVLTFKINTQNRDLC